MKTLVTTLAVGKHYQKLLEITGPQMLKYARRIGAKYTSASLSEGLWKHSAPWAKLQSLHELLGEWDRVLFLDCDALINADECPNLFDIVPPQQLGAYMEGGVCDRIGSLVRAIEFHGLDTGRPYTGEYFNTGVMVLSKMHRDVFIWPENIEDNYYEQGYINARAFASEIPLFPLSYKFNRMSIHDDLTGEQKHAAHIVHYAGSTVVIPPGHKDFPQLPDGGLNPAVVESMEDTMKKWRDHVPAKTRIFIDVGGGLGDAVEAEPVVRYGIEKVFKNDPNVQIGIGTPYPRVLQHIFKRYPNVFHVEDRLQKIECSPDSPYFVTYTHQPQHLSVRFWAPFHAIHNQDFQSLCAFRDVIIPFHDREIDLEITQEDERAVDKLLFEIDPRYREFFEREGGGAVQQYLRERTAVAVHAGTGWKSKTFPADYWQKIINYIKADGMTPVLIGDAKYVPITCPEGGIDLRDKLTLGMLFEVLRCCPILLSNDSSPVHIAGAFDNEIIMIATCKRPELVFPYRRGSVFHKTHSIVGRLTCDHLGLRINNPDPDTMANVVGDIRDYLPSSTDVAKLVSEVAESIAS